MHKSGLNLRRLWFAISHFRHDFLCISLVIRRANRAGRSQDFIQNFFFTVLQESETTVTLTPLRLLDVLGTPVYVTLFPTLGDPRLRNWHNQTCHRIYPSAHYIDLFRASLSRFAACSSIPNAFSLFSSMFDEGFGKAPFDTIEC
uniref:Uncharacterized protein n=1 Tax=Strigamia maritima TaxID=126957 RepID=T1JPF5_STRMM